MRKGREKAEGSYLGEEQRIKKSPKGRKRTGGGHGKERRKRENGDEEEAEK